MIKNLITLSSVALMIIPYHLQSLQTTLNEQPILELARAFKNKKIDEHSKDILVKRKVEYENTVKAQNKF